MAHGQPDYGMYALAKTIYALADMGELAVRLGSINCFDRRGNVIWMDNFEGTKDRWVVTYTGGDGTWEIVSTNPHNGAFSAYLTTAAALGAVAQVGRSLSYPVKSKYGFEIAFLIGATTVPLEFRIETSDETYITTFKIIYNHSAKTLTLVDQDNASQTIESVFSVVAGYWNKVKVVADLVTRKYVRLMINSFSWDISAYGGYPIAVAVPYLVNNYVFITSNSVWGAGVKLDDCILTQNEP